MSKTVNFSANLCILSSGAMMGWTSPVLGYMAKDDDRNPLDSPISDVDSSWVGSLMTVGAIAGSLVAGYMGEKLGRKRSLLFSAVPYTIGWILIATAGSLMQLLIARFIFGIALAIDFTIVPMYCGEIAETSIRGVLGSFLQLFVTLGLLFSYSIGPFVSYTVMWIACSVLPIIFFVCFMFMPESPYFLLSQGARVEASEALARLRGKSTSGVKRELEEMQVSVDQAFATEVSMLDLIRIKANFKALLFTCAAVSFQQFSGINVVLFYSEKIFSAAGTTLDPAICTIIIGVVQVCASGVTPIVVDMLGRRLLLIASGIGTAIGTGVLGLYFKLLSDDERQVADLGWLPIASLVLFMCLYCVGWGPLPWAIMGEMFSAEVKAKASSITVLVCWTLAFFITKYFNNIATAFGNHVAFWIFTVCCIVSVTFVVFLLPETKGKSLQQIQDELNGVKSTDSPGDDEMRPIRR
ncbi:hypothetical protein QAD02_022020 [Eretmocerus hayati]|uniref:Uncharacterized protein n=1 Tax=Eretmocerus hayati TaxID=131215 RepID=A0ACC2PRT4_9HYME|nr:hypothetical protein QAD02_022020 [Eretmocerus hayati]